MTGIRCQVTGFADAWTSSYRCQVGWFCALVALRKAQEPTKAVLLQLKSLVNANNRLLPT